MNTLEQIEKSGIVPVVTLKNSTDAVKLARALYMGGISCIEVTFRTDVAGDSIKNIVKAFPDMCVGAGTVTNINQVDSAIEAGAKFIVSPGLNPKIVTYCMEKHIPIIPGVSTASEIELAIELGLNILKFFPAEQMGGVSTLRALSAPYNNIRFMPTGGINLSNINSYLACPKVIACGGSWMATSKMIENQEFEKIQKIAKESIDTILDFDLAHIGINAENEDIAKQITKKFSFLFGFSYNPGDKSCFAGSQIEVLNSPYLGKNGHIAIRTNDINRAVYYLSSILGVQFNQESAKINETTGKMMAIYFKEEIAGFAIHLLQKL
ncbi:MAG: bifunctional 4-hydroxy-2-oxoglutarate aldolase/2-dehydro-3-deoxy-phosphogluconate aldolase [Alphaproteobacteria bacterium]|nr:bifunctional 4-hydroxy-2-oxoglutarate aldolase/2-dehydro-3-deoxy-phosphogluconate aldolase [Alphaproteobacteria bacterium]